MKEIDIGGDKNLYLKFPNITQADLGLYIVSIPLDGEYIDSPAISLRIIGTSFLGFEECIGKLLED